MKVGPFFDIFVTWKAKTLNNFIFYYMIAHIRLNGKDVPMNTIRKAMQLIENNEPEQAIVLLKRYTDKANEDELQIIAEIFIELGFLQDAENILKQLLKKYPKNSELKIMLSEIYVEWEQDELAISLLNEIDKNDPNYVSSLVQLADLYQVQGLFEVAEQKLLTAKNINPDELLIDFALGELYFSIGEYKKSLIYYEKILPRQDKVVQVSIKERLGEAYAATGEYEKALIYFKENKSKDPDFLYRYGIIAYQADRTDIAIKVWEDVLKIDPAYSTVYPRLAKAYEEDGNIQEALITAKKGIQNDEFQKELYYLAGTYAFQLGETATSKQFAEHAVALDPDYKDAVLLLIEIYKSDNDYEQIITLLTDIKKQGASDPVYEWELAKASIELDRYDDALNHYEDAYNTLNQDSEFLKEYGYFLVEEGMTEKAIAILEKYLELKSQDEEVREYLFRMKDTFDRS